MTQLHNWSISDMENMLPWERDIYVDKLIEYIKTFRGIQFFTALELARLYKDNNGQ